MRYSHGMTTTQTFTDDATATHALELKQHERFDLRQRIRAGIMERGPVVPIKFVQSDTDAARYSVRVEGITVGWVVRRDDLPAMDRWHGYISVPGTVRGNLVATCRQRGEAAEDVALEALR